MGCSSCSSRGCPASEIEVTSNPNVVIDSCNKLDIFNWLSDVPESPVQPVDVVEVRFKNTRKGFYRNVNNIRLKKGDIVAVEASPGHDIGIVSLTGELVLEQMRKYGVNPDKEELKKIYRKAKQNDIDKWKQAMELEIITMLKSRQISKRLKLEMKIGDVEYQGDKTKAIFYYIADERVDFRELIKVLAEEFRVRIEMRQIGARQEAGRIGGVGACGRELCCATWISSFNSVTTVSAKYQELSLNPQKLAGQCSKLKCCLNYELDAYVEVQQQLPDKETVLETREGHAFYTKTDVFKGIMWYSFDKEYAVNLTPVPVERVREVMEMNKAGKIPDKLLDIDRSGEPAALGFHNVVGQDSLTRFDEHKNRKKKKRKKRPQREQEN
ncbi:MAG: regulatory iron-sulfur-containing complex subunit RicT [Bacteroidota bacterium]